MRLFDKSRDDFDRAMHNELDRPPTVPLVRNHIDGRTEIVPEPTFKAGGVLPALPVTTLVLPSLPVTPKVDAALSKAIKDVPRSALGRALARAMLQTLDPEEAHAAAQEAEREIDGHR